MRRYFISHTSTWPFLVKLIAIIIYNKQQASQLQRKNTIILNFFMECLEQMFLPNTTYVCLMARHMGDADIFVFYRSLQCQISKSSKHMHPLIFEFAQHNAYVYEHKNASPQRLVSPTVHLASKTKFANQSPKIGWSTFRHWSVCEDSVLHGYTSNNINFNRMCW